jgi:iron-sulfur cluster repair protein YtfE (RIC family)
MNALLEFPRVADCEPEWQERPVSAIATHVSTIYHEFTRDRLPLIANLAARVATIPDRRRTCLVPALNDLIWQLRDAVETHAWTEDDLLFPVLVAHEHPGVLQTSVSRAELNRLVDALASEHLRIRQIISALDELTNGFRTPVGASGELDDLIHMVKELTVSLLEELDLEDGCLLPRAREIAASRA